MKKLFVVFVSFVSSFGCFATDLTCDDGNSYKIDIENKYLENWYGKIPLTKVSENTYTFKGRSSKNLTSIFSIDRTSLTIREQIFREGLGRIAVEVANCRVVEPKI